MRNQIKEFIKDKPDQRIEEIVEELRECWSALFIDNASRDDFEDWLKSTLEKYGREEYERGLKDQIDYLRKNRIVPTKPMTSIISGGENERNRT